MLRLLGILALGKMIFGGRGSRHAFRGGLLSSLIALSGLIFAGWAVIAVIGGILGLLGSVIGGIFSGLSSLASGIFSGSGILVGIVIGLVLYIFIARRQKKNAPEEEEQECCSYH